MLVPNCPQTRHVLSGKPTLNSGILDALSRRVVGYVISRSIDARVAVAALKAAILVRRRQGLLPHSVEGGGHPRNGGVVEEAQTCC